MNSLGLPELLVIFIISLFWIAPIAAAVWALMMLQRIRTDQQAMGVQLDTIERLLQAGR